MIRASTVLLSSLALLGTHAFADGTRSQLTIVGTGHASASPEYVLVRVTVTSICYDTSLAAANANAVLANRIVTALQSYATDPHDKVTAAGGQNVLETVTVPDGNTYKTLCTMKWKATNDLTIQMAKISDLPALQDKILTAVDQAGAINPSETTQTYAELAAPSFNVYPATMTTMRKQADIDAYNDAKAQRDAFASTCGFSDLRLDRIQPPQYNVVPISQGAAMPMPAGNAVTPILPDQLSVDATWKFDWSFVPGASCF